ncbi:MAG TPA: hypothetical protein VES02_15810 [Dermatophilaceae bacterium]|nr:hypothetical protein [Dermatophilaceae bacterium]
MTVPDVVEDPEQLRQGDPRGAPGIGFRATTPGRDVYVRILISREARPSIDRGTW